MQKKPFSPVISDNGSAILIFQLAPIKRIISFQFDNKYSRITDKK